MYCEKCGNKLEENNFCLNCNRKRKVKDHLKTAIPLMVIIICIGSVILNVYKEKTLINNPTTSESGKKLIIPRETLGMYGGTIVKSAKAAHQAAQMDSSSKIKYKSSVCFSFKWLLNNGYLDNSLDPIHTGSVLITYENKGYSYAYWLSNGTYAFENINPDEDNYEKPAKGKKASETCGGKENVIKCYAQGTEKGSCS